MVVPATLAAGAPFGRSRQNVWAASQMSREMLAQIRIREFKPPSARYLWHLKERWALPATPGRTPPIGEGR